jgi:glutathione synthase/RimK-type ligase-like ATP-grasp enzyme
MSKTALLTLGRLPKSLDIARALADSGWRVLVAEPSARHLTGVSHAVARSFQVTAPVINANAYLDELCSIVRKENVDLVVPVSEETMHVAALADRFVGSTAQGAPRIFTMSPTEVRRLYDKLGFARFAQSIGLTVPSTFEYGDAGAQALIMAGAVVLKPRFSCAGPACHARPGVYAAPSPAPASARPRDPASAVPA